MNITTYNRRKAAGKCVYCGSVEPEPGRVSCKSCSIKRSKKYYHDDEFRKRLSEYHSKKYHDRKVSGICTVCGKASAEHGGLKCKACTMKISAYMKNYNSKNNICK
ncbi:MAG: hypothetical protein K2H01_04775 [Ruminococcus sp.]|nr:hypothetical protein [Ruminococcus sp.]